MIDFDREDIRPFADVWNKRPPSPMRQTKADWDSRAERWVEGLRREGNFKKSNEGRILTTVEFLKLHGLLTPEQDVIDIGCGPGRFVAEFAETARHVTGTDLSDGMVGGGRELCEARGLKNTDFISCDFSRADIDAMGWRSRFDLVFASITPAISTLKEVEKMMAMSRGWCFYAGFRSRGNDFEAQVARELFHKEPPMMKKDGKSTYALFNMLWLSGYDPHVHFYYDENEETMPAEREFAVRLAERLGFTIDDETEIRRILEYIRPFADEDGVIRTVNRASYMWLLWNMNQKQKPVRFR